AVKELDKIGVAYIHFRTGTDADVKHGRVPVAMSVFRALFKNAIILNDGFTREKAESALNDGLGDLIAFGIPFIANPDLPKRLKENAPLAAPDIALLYGGTEKGYIDYPALSEAVR